MQFRCSFCGYVMNNGLPPLEALSPEQSACIVSDIAESDLRFSMLDGTIVEGHSIYGFCTFCTLLLTECTDVFAKSIRNMDASNFKTYGRLSGHAWGFGTERSKWGIETSYFECECGDLYFPDCNAHVLVNRYGRLHEVKVVNPLLVTELMDSLFDE